MIEETALKEQVRRAVEEVRRGNPLVGSVTNAASMNLVANAQLAVGGSAAMVYLPDEGECLAQAGSAFYLNMGTLLPVHGETISWVARVLHESGVPWVLDPVGIGIGSLRTKLLEVIKPYKPSVIRCNASEAIALAGMWDLGVRAEPNQVRGVDSTDDVDAAVSAAVALARWTGGAVAVSGKTDLVTDGSSLVFSKGGSPLMEKFTGAGCSLGGVAAVYAAVASPLAAALAATAHYNLAGARAAQKTSAPASFQVAFVDELYTATADDIAANPFTVKEA